MAEENFLLNFVTIAFALPSDLAFVLLSFWRACLSFDSEVASVSRSATTLINVGGGSRERYTLSTSFWSRVKVSSKAFQSFLFRQFDMSFRPFSMISFYWAKQRGW